VAQKEKHPKSGRTGRPKLPAGAAKSETIRTRFSPEEHGRIEKAAQHEGMSVSDWVRKVLLESA
jgi:predicted HicB family RNase H-like nuclease